jgi:hypothetical protein
MAEIFPLTKPKRDIRIPETGKPRSDKNMLEGNPFEYEEQCHKKAKNLKKP